MKVARVILEAGEDPPRGLRFWCPACDESHVIRVAGGDPWTWNGDVERPTIQPSVKCEHYKLSAEGEAMIDRGEKVPPGERYPGSDYCCHSVITDGQIQFCGDCTHPLANQTVPLPDLPGD